MKEVSGLENCKEPEINKYERYIILPYFTEVLLLVTDLYDTGLEVQLNNTNGIFNEVIKQKREPDL